MMNTNTHLSHIINSIIDAESRFNRRPRSVKLIAVSKNRSIDEISALYEAGQRDFAENKVQEALLKMQKLKKLDICWHFIGPIQSNKTKAISEHFEWVHSVASLKVASRLNDTRPAHLDPLNTLLQINLNQEKTKSGIPLNDALSLCEEMSAFKQLSLRGLMAIPARLDTFDAQKANFQLMNKLFRSLKTRFGFDTLSMGMSNDYEAAISEGATMVRIGSALFE